jgi:hypothetical protein
MASSASDSYYTPDPLNEDLYNHLVLPQKLPHREDSHHGALEVALIERLVSSAKTIAAEAASDDYGAA